MAKISVQPDCGNSPRKIFLKDLYVGLANGKIDIVKENLSDNVNWEIVPHKSVAGKANYLNAVMEHPFWQSKALTIDSIITHGKEACVSGEIITSDGSMFEFCDIIKF